MSRNVRSPNGIMVRVSAKEQRFAAIVARRLVFTPHVSITVGGTLAHRLHVSPDLVFHNGPIAVFYDGCYWHECPEHHPNARGGRGRQQDERNNVLLPQQGWRVIRVWEHEDYRAAAQRVIEAVREIRNAARLEATT